MQAELAENPAETLLQSLWSDVVSKAKRNPWKATFAELDDFVKRYHVFFDAKILTPFSYEDLFKQHFPRDYNAIKAADFFIANWAEKFLSTCEMVYGKDSGKCEFIFAMKNADVDHVKEMIAEKRLTKETNNKLTPEDFANVVFPFRWAYMARLVSGPLDASYEKHALMEALLFHRPLEEITALCAQIDVSGEIVPRLSWIQFACQCGHFEAAKYFVEACNDPGKRFQNADENQRILKPVCAFGTVEEVRFFLSKIPHSDQRAIHTSLEAAKEQGRLDVILCLMDEFQMKWDSSFVEDVMGSAGLHGHLHFLQYLFDVKKVKIENWMVESAAGLACSNGHLNILKYLMEKKSDLLDLKKNNLLKKACRTHETYFSESRLAVIQFLLGRTAMPDFANRADQTIQWEDVISEIGKRIEPGKSAPKAVIFFFEAYAQWSDAQAAMMAKLIKALKKPTQANIAGVESDPEFNAASLQSLVGWCRQYFRTENKSAVVVREVQHLSGVETVLSDTFKDNPFKEYTAEEIKQLADTGWLLELEWERLLLIAARNPIESNLNNVEAFRKKYQDKFTQKCRELDVKSKPYLNSMVSVLPPAVLKHIFFFRPSVNKLTRSFRADSDEKIFAYAFPIEYPKVKAAIAAGTHSGKQVNWGEEFKRAARTAHQNFPPEFAALFMAIRDPRKNIQRVKALLRVDVGHYKMEERDALESTTIYQCARRNGFQAALDEIFLRFRALLKSKAKCFIPAILCCQPIQVLQEYYTALKNDSEANFSLECGTGFTKAIELDSREAVQFFVENKIIVDLNAVHRGFTPLSEACKYGGFETALYLIKCKANPFLLDAENRNKLRGFVFSLPKIKRDEFAALLCESIEEHYGFYKVMVPDSPEKQATVDAVVAIKKALREPSEVNLTKLDEQEIRKALEDESLKPMTEFCRAFLKPLVQEERRLSPRSGVG